MKTSWEMSFCCVGKRTEKFFWKQYRRQAKAKSHLFYNQVSAKSFWKAIKQSHAFRVHWAKGAWVNLMSFWVGPTFQSPFSVQIPEQRCPYAYSRGHNVYLTSECLHVMQPILWAAFLLGREKLLVSLHPIPRFLGKGWFYPPGWAQLVQEQSMPHDKR